MASLACAPSIVVATSIPPNVVRHENGHDIGQKYQRDCIESWIRAGFRILSLNFHDEIGELARQYPAINFIEVTRSNTKFTRRTPLLSDLLSVLADQSEEIVGIINADILLGPGDWIRVIREAVQGAIAVAHRYDIKSLEDHGCGSFYLFGYDAFFFERKENSEKIADHFAMGLPWWDYMLPLTFRLRGLGVNLLTFPIAFHLEHPARYHGPIWRDMGKAFAQSVIEASAATDGSVKRDFSKLLRLCRWVLAAPDVFEEQPKSLLQRARNKLLAGGRPIPVLWRLATSERRESVSLDRLVRASVAVISNSSLLHRRSDTP